MLEALVLVRVNKDNLKELSKPKESNSKILLKINKLRKKSIKTKKAILIFSLLILFSESIILEFKMTLGFTSL